MQSVTSSGSSDGRTVQFLRLLGEHERSLYAFVLAMVAHWADADDIVQETKIRLWEQFDKYQPERDFGAWARSIAYYLVLAFREKNKRDRLRFSEAFCEAVAAETRAAPHLISERQEALLRCLKKLTDARRRVIEMYYAGEGSLSELAGRLGRSYEALRKTIYRTQIALSECVDSELRKDMES